MKAKKEIGKDVKAYMQEHKTDMAESHLECWKDRYYAYGGNKSKLVFDLEVNHDSSCETEEVKEELKRELTTDEETFIIEQFNKEVIKVWQNK